MTLSHMLVRMLIVFGTTLALVRLGEKRFFGERTAFDLVLSIILGSVISRAINGSAPFFPTLLTSAGLVAIHRVLAAIAFHADGFGPWVKGRAKLLVQDGEVDWKAMRRSHLTLHDLQSSLRLEGQVETPDNVKAAYLERNGNISVVPIVDTPQVIEYDVEEGVKKIRIEIQG
jgi:uncharacterized membrane protein YcaP (DUF421 family)